MSDGVEITLDGRSETLRPSLRAARAISDYAGGFAEVFKRLAVFNLETYTVVVAAGLNKKPQEVEEAVYKTGLPDLTAVLSDFVALLANGGRPSANGSDGPGEQ